jgi:multiple sugar transport system ATP-binding protein
VGALRLEGLEKIYPGGYLALAGVDLDVSEGELVVLLGPSGCGKSTLLRIVAGLEAPTRGRVFIGGEDVSELPPQKRDVAMVFQNYALYPHMTVRDNLAFGLKVRRLGREAVAERVAQVAGTLGLAALLGRKPAQLSGGQRQRVALGRAIARKAKLFLLDEPLSNLDVQLRVSTRTELAHLHRSLRVPMLYVTHDQEEAMTLGDRVVVMRAGRFLQAGPPLEIYLRPATCFVAGFVGSPRMNLLRGTLAPVDGGIRIEALGGALRLQLPRAGVGGAGAPGVRERPDGVQPGVEEYGRPGARARDVFIGIRPEDVEIVGRAEADLLAQADVVEPLGRELLLHVVVTGMRGDATDPLRVLAGAGTDVVPGSALGLRLRRDRLHFFDAATEERLADFS